MCIYFFLILLIGYNPELNEIKDSVTYSACETFTRFILTRKKFRLFNNRELWLQLYMCLIGSTLTILKTLKLCFFYVAVAST